MLSRSREACWLVWFKWQSVRDPGSVLLQMSSMRAGGWFCSFGSPVRALRSVKPNLLPNAPPVLGESRTCMASRIFEGQPPRLATLAAGPLRCLNAVCNPAAFSALSQVCNGSALRPHHASAHHRPALADVDSGGEHPSCASLEGIWFVTHANAARCCKAKVGIQAPV